MWSSGSAKLGAAAGGLLGVAVLQQLDHDIVELDEAHVQALRAASQVRDAHGARIDPAHARLDLLVGQQRVVDALALEVAVAHHLGAAEHLGIEFEGAVHVLHGEPEMLHALQPRAERPVVARRGAHPTRLLRCRRRCGGTGQSAQHRGADGLQRVAALQIRCIAVSMFAHGASPCSRWNIQAQLAATTTILGLANSLMPSSESSRP